MSEMLTIDENAVEISILDCANCKKIFENEDEVTTELKTFVSPEENSPSNESSVQVQIVDILAYIYEIQWDRLLMHLCHEEEKKYNNEDEAFKVLLCSQCAEFLTILYKAYLDFESLTNSDSLIRRAKEFRSKSSGKPCSGTKSDATSENSSYYNNNEEELFDSFNFDANPQADFVENELECKYNPSKSTGTKLSRLVGKSTRKSRSSTTISNSNCTLAPPGKRMIVKLEKISDEELSKISDRQRIKKSKKKSHHLVKRKVKRGRGRASEGELSCSVCEKKFTSSQNLWRHRQIHRKDRAVQCDICGKVLSSKKYMEKHRKNHREDRAVNCEICGKLLASKEAIRMHNSRVHISEMEKDMQRIPCEICGKMVLGDNKSHMLTHTQEKEIFKCDKCGKTFYSKERLDLHLEAHESTQIFKCQICNREFPIQKYLDEHHERHHNSEKPYACDKCPIKFANKCHLEKHLIVHSTERPFVCEECGKTFKRKNHLKKHVQCHRDEELGPDAFKCTHCGKCLRNSVSFKIHTLQFHRSDLVTAKKIHECTVCGKRLFDEKNLKKHYAAVHKEYTPLNCFSQAT